MGKVSVVRMAAIYGANGAGKSNLIKALDLLQEAASSEKIPNEKISPHKFGTSTDCKFPQIEVELFINNKFFLYGLSLTQNRVVEEWLYESGLGNKQDTLIFERSTAVDGKTKITFAAKNEQNAKAKLRKELYENEFLKSHSTLLWQLNQAKEVVIEEANHVFDWFENHLLVMRADEFPEGIMEKLLNDPGFHTFCNEFLPSLDTGVSELVVKTEKYKESNIREDAELLEDVLEDLEKGEKSVPLLFSDDTPAVVMLEDNELVIKTLAAYHQANNNQKVLFDFKEESDGTRKLTEFLSVFYGLKTDADIIVIDEIERSIHPSLIREILKKLADEKEAKGQLIFTTHEAGLLDLDMFRQDEIWFAEKNETGATKLYPLSDFAIRPDLNIEKGYLLGRFGAVPSLVDLKKMDWKTPAHAEN
ncbi:MAG: AAA family ATPase [Saprospiraceae bacterium]|nr:AAA family ATPase [Saprospiraceae bacterium]